MNTPLPTNMVPVPKAEGGMTKHSYKDIYIAAKALITFYRENSGCSTGDLIKALGEAVDEYDSLAIPKLLQREPADEWTVVGGEDGKDQ